MLHTDEAKLRQYLTKYKNPDITRKDIVGVINQYKGLALKQETYVFNDGTPRELVNLTGTIPVTYKGAVYNIPVCIWLMDTHPYNAPLCYVKPTSDMNIKVSIFVDQNGKIYLPYLHDWVPNSSDLEGLIQVMIVTFGEQPPVYAKPRESNVPYPTSYMSQPGGMPPVIPSSSGYAGYPSFPPYPPAPASSGFPPGVFDSLLAYPPHGGTSMYSNQNLPSYPMPYGPQQPVPGTSGSGTTGTITDEHIRASLMSAIEDKLKRRMKEQFSQHQAELETLRRTHQELVQGKTKLDDILTRLESEQNELDKNIKILQDKEQELDKSIARLANEESIDVDNAVTTTAPLYKQLLNCFAEEAAIEDAIYYMGEALRQGVIDLEVFLKQVRALSRKQFMLRATMQACRKKAGLAG